MFGSYGSIVGFVDLDTTKLEMGVTRAAAGLKGLEAGTGNVGKAFKALAIGGATVGAVIAGASLKMAADFDQSMRKVWSLTRESEATFKSWKEQVKEASRDLPQSANEMAQAMYWITSNMPDATSAQRFETLDIAARGAVGGVAELSDTVQALTSAQNAYKDMDPAKYMDIMNKAVERGSLTLQDFVNNQGKFIGTAAQFKIPFEEVAAAMATLTRNAIPADTAAMAINQTMMAYLKPTEDAVKVAQNYGIELSANTLKSRGFGGAMMDLANAMQDDNSEIAQMFPNIRSLKAILPLSGLAAQEFAKDLNEVGNAAGTTDNMFAKNKDSLQNIIKTVWGKFQLILINIGEKIMPKVSSALEAVGRILDGQNEAFNRFAGVVKAVVTPVLQLTDALLKFWPVLLMVGGGIAAIKFSGFLSAVTAASTGIPLLNNAIANLKLGFTTGMASVGGFATSVATVGLVAAPAAIGIALLTKHVRDTDKAAEAAWNSIRKNDIAMGDLGRQIQPLIGRYEELRSITNRSAEQQSEMVSVGNEIVQLAPTMATGFDSLGNAILKSDEQLNQLINDLMKYSGVTITEKGEAGQYEGLIKSTAKYEQEAAKLKQQLNYVSAGMQALGVDGTDVRTLVMNLSKDFESGSDMAKAWISRIKESGDLDPSGPAFTGLEGNRETLKQVELALSDLKMMYDQNEMSLSDWQTKIQEANMAIAQLAPQIVENARAIGQSGQAFSEELMSYFTSNIPQMQEVGVQAFSAYIEGLSQGQIAPDMAGQIAQQMFNQGTFTATGVASVDAALAAMSQQMQVSNIAGVARDLAAKVGEAFKGIGGDKTEEKKLTLNVTDGGTAQSTDKSLKQVQTSADKLGKSNPKVTASANTAQANAAVSRLVNRLSDINGQTLATVYVQALIKGSGPFTADEYVTYLEDKIGGAAPTLMVGAKLSNAYEDIKAAWDAMNATALPAWSSARMSPAGDMSVEDWEHINEAIANLGGNVAANLQGWWDMNGAVTRAEASLKEYTAASEKAEERLDALQTKQTTLNESLNKHKERLSELSQMKLKGEGAADDKSFAQTQAINKLELERLQIQQRARAGTATEADYNRLFVIAQKKQELELEKQIGDLQTSVTYDPQRRQIEKLLDPLEGQEMTQKAIVKAVKAEQKAIAEKERQLVKVEKQIKKEQAEVKRLRKAYDAAYKVVSDYSNKIDEMARNFLDHYQKMIAAQEELNRQMSGTSGGAMVSGSSEYSAEATLAAGQMQGGSTNMTTSTSSVSTVNYFMFDKLILPDAHDVPSLTRELRMAKLRMSV